MVGKDGWQDFETVAIFEGEVVYQLAFVVYQQQQKLQWHNASIYCSRIWPSGRLLIWVAQAQTSGVAWLLADLGWAGLGLVVTLALSQVCLIFQQDSSRVISQ